MELNTLEKREKIRFLTVVVMTLIILSLFLVIQTFTAIKEYRYIGSDIKPQTTMAFSGEGEMIAVPDVAEFTFSVQREAEEVASVQQQVARAMAEIDDYLAGEGIEDQHIKTVNYNVRPRYEFRDPVEPTERGGQRVLVGFEVTQTTRVQVKDMDRAGELVGGVGERGATQVSNVRFSVEDETAVKREARQLAIADAKEQARLLSDDLGVKLIRIVDFREERSPSFPQLQRATDMVDVEALDAPRPDFAPGEQEVVSRVEITYEIR